MSSDGWVQHSIRRGFGNQIRGVNRTPACKHLREYRFHKGKHAGKTWDQVYAVDMDYMLWMESNKSFTKSSES